MAEAPLIEIFSSIQGEGRFSGMPMTFVRVAVCPVRCTYCDTPDSYVAPPSFPVRIGTAESNRDNPISAADAAELATRSAAQSPYGRATFVSVTGGEPLVHPRFVQELGLALRQRGLRLFLESAAIDAKAFAHCADAVDHASFDYKLPGTLATGDPERLGAQCIASVSHAVKRYPKMTVDVKLVLTRVVDPADIATALAGLASFRKGIVLVLQPVTPFLFEDYPCPPERVAEAARLAVERGFDIRVLPQVQKALGVP